jgi:hypothetical protein
MIFFEWPYEFVLFQGFLAMKLSWTVCTLIDGKIQILVVFSILLQARLGFK